MKTPQLRGLPRCPRITAVTKPLHGSTNFGGIWHSGTTYLEHPPMADLLDAVKIPLSAGDTLFSTHYFAYEALLDGLKKNQTIQSDSMFPQNLKFLRPTSIAHTT